MRQPEVGDRMLVFDALAWWPVGDVGDNATFWRPATIERVYESRRRLPCRDCGDLLADIRWDDGVLSMGHIVSAMRPLPAEAAR